MIVVTDHPFWVCSIESLIISFREHIHLNDQKAREGGRKGPTPKNEKDTDDECVYSGRAFPPPDFWCSYTALSKVVFPAD